MEILGIGMTDIGSRRKNNEDAFLCDALSKLFIVADGMGARVAGETASKVVVTVFPVILKEMMPSDDTLAPEIITSILKEALCRLSCDLYQRSQEILEVRGLGSTAAILFINRDRAYIAYAGDSRVYLLRDAQLIRITEDQTTAAALVRSGYLSPDMVEQHPLRHALEEYVGKAGTLNPGVQSRKLHVGDRWLLCSDGLIKGIEEDQLCELLLRHDTPENACRALISSAKNADGTDNITAIVVDIAVSQS